jgi:two-component system, response regulator PdtaR
MTESVHSRGEPPDDVVPDDVVLVVEDDVLLRALTVEYLEDCDFSVLQAETAEDAIRLLLANRHIGVVFSDVQMPGSMDGVDLAHWIGRELPRVKVLLTSGKVGRGEVGEWPLLAKPYQLGELEGQLRGFLELS